MGQALLPSFSLRARQLVDRSHFSASRLARGNLWTWLFCHILVYFESAKNLVMRCNLSRFRNLCFWPQMTPNTTILGSDVLGWPRNLLFLNNGIKSFFLVYNLSRFENVWIWTWNHPKYHQFVVGWPRMTSETIFLITGPSASFWYIICLGSKNF